MSRSYSQGFTCCQSMACLVGSCITRVYGNRLNPQKFISTLSVRMRCKYLLKCDGLSKQNIVLTMGRVCAAMGRLLHSTENISADVPQCTNNITKCALCETNCKTPSQGRFEFCGHGAHRECKEQKEKHSRIQEFGGDGYDLARFVRWIVQTL